MKPHGPSSGLYLIGEAPGEQEDVQGRQFYEGAEAGSTLRTNMRKVGLNPSLWRMNNSIQCHKPGNVAPTEKEMLLCRNRVMEDIRQCKPKHIIVFGNSGLFCLLGRGGITLFRGRAIPHQDLKAWVYPIVHPSAVNRDERQLPFFKQDLSMVANNIKSGKPIPKILPFNVECLTNCKDIVSRIEWLMQFKHITIDFETVNIRPYLTNSRLVSVAATPDGVNAVSFVVDKTGNLLPKERKLVRAKLKELIYNENIGKTVHNIAMEYEWCWENLRTLLRGKIHDTMQMNYVLDSRPKIHSLAFVTFSLFGIQWKSVVDRYKKNMDQCPTDLLLYYGGQDVIWTHRDAEILLAKLAAEPRLQKLYEGLQMPGGVACANIMARGVPVDNEWLDNQDNELKKKIAIVEAGLRKTKPVRKYEKTKRRRLNFGSTDDVSELLYDEHFMALKSVKLTTGSQKSVDAGVLAHHYKEDGQDVCNVILQLRELVKQKSSWVDGIRKVAYPDGKLHQQLNNTFTRTGRLSSSDPDLQNFPKRKNHHMRSMIVAPHKFVILSGDYDQLEAACLGIESGDSNFKRKFASGYDIHKQKAIEIYRRRLGEEDAISKRGKVKNKFVFPTFYGAGPTSVARDLGITLEEAQEHQNILWEEFPDIRRWQRNVLRFYEKYGYVESRTGRRRYGPLLPTEAVNTPIQGLASDICVRSMIVLVKRGYYVGMNVHDELDVFVPEDDAETHITRVHRVMTTLPKEWVDDVQLRVSLSIGYNWYETLDIDVH